MPGCENAVLQVRGLIIVNVTLAWNELESEYLFHVLYCCFKLIVPATSQSRRIKRNLDVGLDF